MTGVTTASITDSALLLQMNADQPELLADYNDADVGGEEEEALSLCDLPTNDNGEGIEKQITTNEEQPGSAKSDFDFGSWGGSVFTESVMCNADEVFYQGQILPLRHSVSSDSALTGLLRHDTRNLSRSVSRAESLDHFSTRAGYASTMSSRSSSASSTSSTRKPLRSGSRTRNQFHSHPSPTPKIRTTNVPTTVHPNHQKSSMWSFLQLGLLRTPEIGLAELKARSKNNNMKRFGSHNSNSSSCNSNSSSNNNNTLENRRINNAFRNDSSNNNSSAHEEKKKTKKKQRLFFQKNGRILGGCKCSVSSIVESGIVLVKTGYNTEEEEKLKEERAELLTKKMNLNQNKKTKQQIQGKKQAMSRHRTFEWLKQLSLQEAQV